MDEILNEIENDLGGFGPTTIQNIRQSFDSEEELTDALEDAYWDRNTERLQEVELLGEGYAKKVGRWYGRYMDYSNGDLEPTPINFSNPFS